MAGPVEPLGCRMTSTKQITRPRYDELLYSAFARVSAYLGSPPRARLHDAVIGADISIFDDLPVGIGRVVASGAFGPADVDGAIHEWTMFPYYAHFAGTARADAAIRAMKGEGVWPHQVLGCQMAAPNRLRFCATCRVDMLEQRPDAWWRRSHQMPSALVCPDHGEPLKESNVTRERRRGSYILPTDDECPVDALAVAIIDRGISVSDLLVLARSSDTLLDERVDVHPDDRREIYLQRLGRLGMLNRRGEAKLPAVAEAVNVRWGGVLGLWPGLARDGVCLQGWLGALLMGEHGSPPLHHLLLDGALKLFERRF